MRASHSASKAVLGIRAWQKRYFVLSSVSLTYWKSHQDQKAQEPALDSIALDLVKNAQVPLDNDKGTRLDVHVENSERVYELRADDMGECQVPVEPL